MWLINQNHHFLVQQMMKILGKIYWNKSFELWIDFSLVNILFVLIPKLNLPFQWYELNLFKIVLYTSDRIFKGIFSLNISYSKCLLFRLTNLGPDLLVADDTGFLYRISWDGVMHPHLTLSLSALTYTTSLSSDRGLFYFHPCF